MQSTASGVVKRIKRGAGTLRDPGQSFRRNPADIAVPAELMSKYRIVEGASVTGPVNEDTRSPQLAGVDTICGLAPDEFQLRTPFTDLVPITPDERFNLAPTGDPSMRVIDLVAPIGKGTRGLIVSPPKAGKTMMLMQLANAIKADAPESRVVVLLIDERPEEVTHFRRSVDAEVLASSNDQSVKEHVELAEMTLAHARIELECGRDVVILVDSLTRMGRAFNLRGSRSGRTMSGGLEAGALEIPRRFFGLARNIENGGSVTIIATALVDTGSRMDEFIFQEFKGTGNSEIVLDRSLAESRIFPAVNVPASGTRREEMLYSPEQYKRIVSLRRVMTDRPPIEAMKSLLKLFDKYPTNAELLQIIPA